MTEKQHNYLSELVIAVTGEISKWLGSQYLYLV